MSISLYFSLFAAGLITILLPCILPLIPVVLGVSVSGKNPLRPLVTVLGMLVSFVVFTFILQVLLNRFVGLANDIQIATYYILLLFGICFLTENTMVRLLVAILGGFFFYRDGWIAVTVAETLGAIAVDIGGRVATKLQQLGSDVQQSARAGLGADSLLTALIIGLTLGLVWVPCAGPALGFALALVRNQPGPVALLALFTYALGAAIPLLIIGYGGQVAVHSVRAIGKYSGRIKQVAGVLLIACAVAFQYGWFVEAQTWLADHVPFGDLGNSIEESLFAPPAIVPASSSSSEQSSFSANAGQVASASASTLSKTSSSAASTMNLPILPKIVRAPEFTGLGPWYNSAPLTLASLKGKVVLVDFWTYSCINCIRTLPYVEGYWNKYKGMPFVLIGVHTPEFVFEKDPANVGDAIKRHGLTYPIAQDNDYGTWTAFANQYWPAKYLIDANGYIRYTHFGEGDYDQTDLAVQSLLKETGHTIAGPLVGANAKEETGQPVSPETYVGTRNWPSFSNSLGDPDTAPHQYSAPATVPLNQYALTGRWQLEDEESQVIRSAEGQIRYHALGGEVNLVLGLEPGVAPVKADITVDGKKTTTITIDRHDLFNLFTGPYGEHDIVLTIHGKGVQAYAFTFGS